MIKKLLAKFTWLQSSVDPNQVSLTIKGLASLVPTAVLMAHFVGYNIVPDVALQVIDCLAIIGSSVATVFGLARKVIVKLDQTPPQ